MEDIAWLQWLITAIFVPVIGYLVMRINKTAADLAQYKTEVAEKYATQSYLRDSETKILKQLDKIEGLIEHLRSDRKS